MLFSLDSPLLKNQFGVYNPYKTTELIHKFKKHMEITQSQKQMLDLHIDHQLKLNNPLLNKKIQNPQIQKAQCQMKKMFNSVDGLQLETPERHITDHTLDNFQ